MVPFICLMAVHFLISSRSLFNRILTFSSGQGCVLPSETGTVGCSALTCLVPGTLWDGWLFKAFQQPALGRYH
jgi:hypothetical protein